MQDEGPNIVDQVLTDVDDEMADEHERLRDEDDEEGAYVRESGELNLNDNVGTDDMHNEGDTHKRRERSYDKNNNGTTEAGSDNLEGKKEQTACCTQCLSKNKHTGRACICQVPSKLRRGSLGRDGCFTCHCTGCHPDDVGEGQNGHEGVPREERSNLRSSRTQDRQPNRSERIDRAERERPRSYERQERPERNRKDWGNGNDDEPLKNGCCRGCMKAFSETKRACLCQVPFDVRLGVLPESGCKICGCKGCHPEEAMMKKNPRARLPPAPPRYATYPPLPPYYPPPIPPPRHSRDDAHNHGLLPYPIPPFPYPPPPGSRDYDPYRYYERDVYRDSRERLAYDRDYHERDHDRERDRDRERDTRDRSRESRDRERGRDRERERDIRALRDERERDHRDRRGERDYDREREYERGYDRDLVPKRARERDYHRSPPPVSKRARGSPI